MHQESRPGRWSLFRGRIGFAAASVLLGALVFVPVGESKAKNAAAITPTPAPAFTPAQQTADPGDNWIVVHGNLSSQNNSTLNQINTSNVSTLKQSWQIHLGGPCATNAQCSGEGNALVYDGVMYIQNGADAVYAVDAATGNTIWQYTPTWDPGFTKVGGVSRGIAMGQGLLYVPQIDGKLVALSMANGGLVWSTVLGNWHTAYQLTAAPVYYKGMVYIGMSGGDSGNSDYVTAVNAQLGNVVWHWNVVPVPGAEGYNTWGGPNEYISGGGAMWDSVSVDPTTNLVFIGTGNPVPWNTRPAGKELFVDSEVALNASTGQMQWYYQTVHHDIWDDDIPSSAILFNGTFRPYTVVKPGSYVEHEAQATTLAGMQKVGMKIKYTGKAVKQPALAIISKMGEVFILNRKTGVPLIPTPEMSVSQANATGMGLSKTQPIPVGDNITSTCVLPTQWTAVGPDGNPVKKGCLYSPINTNQYVAIPHDEDEWMPSAYDAASQNVYVCSIDNRAWAMEALTAAAQSKVLVPGAGYTGILLTQGTPGGYTGGLTAFNLETQKIVWRDNWPGTATATAANPEGDVCYSGVTATAGGLLFVGHDDGHVSAYDQKTGNDLWDSATAPGGANAPVVTYTVGGKQYVSVLQGGNSHEKTPRGDTVTTWALP